MMYSTGNLIIVVSKKLSIEGEKSLNRPQMRRFESKKKMTAGVEIW